MKPVITIHNYEQYFLLYADGELTAADAEAVLQFVQENPQLAGELEILQQMKLPVEPVFFADKELLYKNGAAEIGLENYETWFLLYVDDELDAAEKVQVETFVLQHPGLQEQFLVLKQARLQPDPIVFEHKELLYRKEEDRPVIFMRWQRIAVAAALIGLAVITWFLLPAKNEVNKAVMAKAGSPAVKPGPTQQPPAANAGTNRSVASQAANSNATVAVKVKPVPSSSNAPVPEKKPAPVTSIPDQTVLAHMNAEPVSTSTDNSAAVTNRTPVQVPRIITASNDAAGSMAINAVNNQPEKSVADIAQPAVYKELDTEDEKKSLYVGSLEINKDKLRGFFRKASSLFRGKAKQQEEDKTEATPSSSNTRSLR